MKIGQLNALFAVIAASALVVGCATTPKEEAKTAAPATATPAQPQASNATAPATRSATAQPAVANNPLNDPSNILSKRSAYYAYDKYAVTAEYRPLVEAHAKYLRDHPGATIKIEGNCDERGSREYNIALGQRRADGVRNMMTLLGVSKNRIDTVSFGKEKPKAAGHDESAWSQNRRSDIVYERVN